MKKHTTLYVCETDEIVDTTTTKLMNKHHNITVYDKGVLVRKTSRTGTYIELVQLKDLDTVVEQEQGYMLLKGLPEDKVSEYTGLVKYIVVEEGKVEMNKLRTLSNKKMIKVSSR